MNTFFARMMTLCLTLAILLSACQPDNVVATDEAIAKIPTAVSSVVNVNMNSMMDKMDYKTLSQKGPFKDMLESSSVEVKSLFENPEESGINFDKNAYFFVDTEAGGSEPVLVVNLSDAAKFEKAINASNFDKEDGYKLYKDGRQFVAWDDNVAFVGEGGKRQTKRLGDYFSLKKSNSIASYSGFKMNDNADMNIWLSGASLQEIQGIGMATMMLGVEPQDYKDSKIYGTMDFRDGEGILDLNVDAVGSLGELLETPFHNSLTTDFSSYMPSDANDLVLTFALDIQGLADYLQGSPFLKGMLENQVRMNEYGLNINDIGKAIQGDIMFCVRQATSDKEAAGVFGIKINPKKFNDILEVAIEQGFVKKSADGVYALTDQEPARDFARNYGSGGSQDEAKLFVQDGILFITANDDWINSIRNGGFAKADRIDASTYKMISNGIFNVITTPENIDLDARELEKVGVETLSAKIEKGKIKVEIKTDNPNENILKRFSKSLDEM